MYLLQQAIQLLTDAPGNIVYHLITLLTLQVVFGISRSQVRRDAADLTAQRMSWAAMAIFAARLGLLLVGILSRDDPTLAVSILPPLEQAAHTLTAVLIVWALMPHSLRFPRLGDTLLLISIIIITVMTIFFIQEWHQSTGEGLAYNSSWQVTVWGVLQMSTLGIGLILNLLSRQLRNTLSPVVILLLLLAHAASFWNYPEILVTDTDIAYWIRLGQLTAFPIWAAMVYRHSLSPIWLDGLTEQPSTAQLRELVAASTQLIESSGTDLLWQTIQMTSNLISADFVAVALRDQHDQELVHVTGRQQAGDLETLQQWAIPMTSWPAFRLADEQKQPVQLMPNGLGARQLHNLYEYMSLPHLGALLILPVTIKASRMTLLLVAGPDGYEQWSNSDKSLLGALADFLAQAIENRYQQPAAVPETALAEPQAKDDAPVSGRVIALEEERSRLLAELETATSRLKRSESQAAAASRQAHDLAATLEEMERFDRDKKVTELESEIAALRESLIEAEEAMALAAASEGELSTDWVMMTITRYSGQLEEAQARIQRLEAELAQWEKGPVNQVIASLAQELRTPMTSIAGYTDLLLGERMGILGAMQRDFLQRIESNSQRMSTLLEQIVQMATTGKPADQSEKIKEIIDIQEAVEVAISSIIAQIRDKELRLELDIAQDLPPVDLDRFAFTQVMTSLLGNACQSSGSKGRIAVSAHTHTLPRSGSNGHSEMIEFLQLSVTDSGGGIREEDRSRVFDPQHRAESPLIDGLGDTGVALSVARTLTEANGGRIWMDSEIGVGSTFSTLFPLSPADINGKGMTDSAQGSSNGA